jgi:cell division protein FtsB
MSGWTTVAIVAILVWGVIQFVKAANGITRDQHGNETLAPREDGRAAAELEAARRELADLRERIKVLERIATDANSGDAREQARIAAEIEALRTIPAQKKEQSE